MNPEENLRSEAQTSDVNLDSLPSGVGISSTFEEKVLNEKDKKKSCEFPTAYSILLIIELIVFILTYIIPKGLYDKISYLSDEEKFMIKYHNGTIERFNATQDLLDKLEVKIPLDSFIKGYISDPISIPNTYHQIDSEFVNPLKVLLYPIKGWVDSAYISIFLMVIGGNINILIEMNSLSSGMAALSRITKGREFLLLILVFIIIAIGGTTFGLAEETLAFYPILMPIFLKSGFDGILASMPLFMASNIGCMFSTVNTFCVVIASYSAGINFINGIVFRVILLIFGSFISILYIYIYYRRVKVDEERSVVFEYKEDFKKNLPRVSKALELEIKEEEDNNKDSDNNENNNNDIESDNLVANENKEEKKYEVEMTRVQSEQLISKNNSETEKKEEKNDKFLLKQKISIILFISAFVVMITGILIFSWYFEHMTAIFIVLGIFLMFFYNKGEKKAIECFLKGAGDFITVTIVIGIARGINLTLNDGKISDTILNSLSNAIGGLPKLAFAIIIFIIFIFLGIFIQSSTGLAVLSMPVFAPLADQVNLSRVTVVNAYMFGEYLAAYITPTGLVLIILSLVNIQYSSWIKFIWPFILFLFVLLVFFVMISAYID